VIHVLEGPNFCGKTTQAARLAAFLSLPILEDPVARGGLLGPLGARDWVVMGVQRDLDLAVVSRHLDAVVDRWLLTPRVYDARRFRQWPVGVFERAVALAEARVYLLEVSPEILLARSRGDRPEVRHLRAASELVNAYQAAAVDFERTGGDLRRVNGEGTEEEVLEALARA